MLFRSAVKHPEDFLIKRVGKKQEKLLSESGYKVTPRKLALIPLGKYDDAKLTKNSIVFSKGKITDETFLNSGPDFFKTVSELDKIKLKKNQYFTVRVNDHRPFQRYFKNSSDLMKYLDLWSPQDAKDRGLSEKQTKELRDKLVSQMSIVTYTVEKNEGRKTWSGKRTRESLKRRLQ